MEEIIWHTEKRKVKDLKPYKSNPRQISKDQLAQLKRSLEKFNYVEIAAIQPDNTIIAGHMRVKAMMQLGWGKNEIEVRVPNRHLSEDEMREYLIRSNRNTGDWDWDELGNNWNMSDLHSWGFTAHDFDLILEDEDEVENKEKIDDHKDKCSMCGQVIKNKTNANK